MDRALQNLNSREAEVSALHSRLDFALSANLILSENLEEARSRAAEADFALETAELVRHQILQQAQVAALTQANLNMNLLLELLRDL